MSEDYKSLEHLIRNITSKTEETVSEKKSLEHTIREIREGYISVGKKTSKFGDLTGGTVYGDRTQPIHQHAVQPKQPKGNDALEKAKEAIASHDWAGEFKASQETIAKDKEEFAKSGRKLSIHREESSFGDRTTKPIDEKKKKVDEEEPRLHSEMNVNVSGRGKFTGNEFSSIPVRGHMGHVKPDSHSDKAETAGMARKMAKEKLGKNRVAEENIEEASTSSLKTPKEFFTAPETPSVLDQAISNTKQGSSVLDQSIANTRQNVPVQKPVTVPKTVPLEKSATSKIISKAPVVARFLSRMAGPLGVAAAVMEPTPAGLGDDEFARQAKYGVAKTPEPATKPSAEPAVEPKTEPKPKVATLPDTQVTTKPAVEPKTEPKPETEPKPKVAADLPSETAPKEKKEKDFKLPGFGAGITADTIYHKDYLGRPPSSVGHAKAHKKHGPVKEEVERKKIQNVPRPDAGDRHKIAFVGRKDDDPKTAKEKTSRQAAYKVNVIDEGKKLAGIIKGVVKDTKERREDGKTIVYPQVIINPNLKHNTMDADSDKMPNDHK